MAREVELSSLDLRYEGFRLKAPALEERLLGSIAQRGIEEPLEGVEVQGRGVLLNGFKRYRCARQLRLATVPYRSLGQDEAAAILGLLRASNDRALSILEQAAFIDELKKRAPDERGGDRRRAVPQQGLGEHAPGAHRPDERPGAPATLRRGLSGLRLHVCAASVHAHERGEAAQIEEFVMAVSGKGLSVREVEQLAHGYFRGPESFREEIRKGNLALPLERMRQVPQSPDGCSEFERVLLGDLELTQKYMQRVMGKSQDPRLQSRAFHAQCHLLTPGILSRSRAFFHTLRQLHDRNGQA